MGQHVMYTRYVDAIICTFWRENMVLKTLKKKSRMSESSCVFYLPAATCVSGYKQFSSGTENCRFFRSGLDYKHQSALGQDYQNVRGC